jgi:MarR-like DNA-binding transcriptional regulator SgrR of sgrS sRNA
MSGDKSRVGLLSAEVRWYPVGTGPFRLARWKPSHRLVFEGNPRYFRLTLPYHDRIERCVIPAGVTRITAAHHRGHGHEGAVCQARRTCNGGGP